MAQSWTSEQKYSEHENSSSDSDSNATDEGFDTKSQHPSRLSQWNSYRIKLRDLIKIRDSLMKLSALTPKDIMTIWIEPGEEKIEDFENIEYSYSMPLYKKMILRFQREGISDPGCFIKVMHPSCQRQICGRYGIWNEKIFEFFGYIKFSYGSYQISDMGLDVGEWKSKTSIQFFFDLSDEMKKQFIDTYNAMYDRMDGRTDDRTDDKISGEYVKIPLDSSGLAAKEIRRHFEELDKILDSNELRKNLFEKKPKFKYTSYIQKPGTNNEDNM